MGSVRCTESGEWVIRYQTAAGVDVELSTPASSRDEAEWLLHHCECQAWAIRATGAPLTPTPEPWRDLWAWWAQVCLPRYSPAWRRTVIQLARDYLLPAVGHLYAGEIRPLEIEARFQSWIDGGMAPRTANAIRSVGKTVVRDAIRDGRWPLLVNPFALTNRAKVPRPIWPTLAAEDARRLLSHTAGWRRVMWAIAVYLGLRRGELFALRRSDIDAKLRAINVQRSHDRPTTKAGVARRLPITDELWEIAEPHIATLGRDAPVFSGRRGHILNRDFHLPRILRADLESSGVIVPDAFRAHDLRHTFATLATESGVSHDVIRLTMGHAGGVTADYQHISLAAHRKELSKMSLREEVGSNK